METKTVGGDLAKHLFVAYVADCAGPLASRQPAQPLLPEFIASQPR